MKILLNTAVLALVLVSGNTQSAPVSNPMTATHLYSACIESKSDKYAKGFCDGAIDAFASAIQDWCVPANVTHGEVKEQVKNDLLKTTPPVFLGALEFVSRAIQKKWPCI